MDHEHCSSGNLSQIYKKLHQYTQPLFCITRNLQPAKGQLPVCVCSPSALGTSNHRLPVQGLGVLPVNHTLTHSAHLLMSGRGGQRGLSPKQFTSACLNTQLRRQEQEQQPANCFQRVQSQHLSPACILPHMLTHTTRTHTVHSLPTAKGIFPKHRHTHKEGNLAAATLPAPRFT